MFRVGGVVGVGRRRPGGRQAARQLARRRHQRRRAAPAHTCGAAGQCGLSGTARARRYSLLVGDGCLCGGALGAGGVPSSTGAAVTRSRKASSWRSDSALCSVSSGRMAGTPPKPSTAAETERASALAD